jgi:hypothetical protein
MVLLSLLTRETQALLPFEETDLHFGYQPSKEDASYVPTAAWDRWL